VEKLLKVSQQTSWQLFGKIITSLTTLFILSLISRNFGEAQTGTITLALTYLAFFSLVADFGINAHILPSFIEGDITLKWRKMLGFRTVFTICSALAALIGIILWPNINEEFQKAVLIGLFGVFEGGIWICALAVFQSKLRYDLAVTATVLGTLTTLIMVVLLVNYQVSPSLIMLAYVAGWIVTGTVAFWGVSKLITTNPKTTFIKQLLPIIDWNYIRRIIKESWPISLTLILNIAYFRLDTFILSFLKTFNEVGIYNVSFQVFQAALVVPAFIMNSYYPLMLKSFKDDNCRFFKELAYAGILMVVLGFTGTITTLFLAPMIINIITGGQGFTGSVQALQILSLGFPAYFLSAILMWTMITLKKYKTMLVVYLIGLLFNVFLNFLLIPQYSFIAASFVTVVSEYLILIIQLFILLPLFFKRQSLEVAKI